jgi:hypothetical protein
MNSLNAGTMHIVMMSKVLNRKKNKFQVGSITIHISLNTSNALFCKIQGSSSASIQMSLVKEEQN